MAKTSFSTIFIAAAVSAVVAFGTSYFVMKSGKAAVSQPTGDEASAYVKQALMNDPGMLDDVFLALQNAREEGQAKTALSAIESVKPALYADKRDQALGPETAKYTVVEFFDYNCGFCKTAALWTRQQLEEHPDDFRIIFKDLPLLEGRAPGSQEASIAAMAVWKQGADLFRKFHFSMMEAKGGFDSERIDQIAGDAGVDVAKMRADMLANKAEFEKHLSDNFALATALSIDGTPAFIAGGIFVSGANIPLLQQLLDEKLAES